MGRKVFQDFANTLPAMLVGWRMAEDLEKLAELPDGTLTIDVLNAMATHAVTGAIALHIAGELQAWLRHGMTELNIPAEELSTVIIAAEISTSRIATDRKRIVEFDFACSATLISGQRAYRGSLNERHVWHRRLG